MESLSIKLITTHREFYLANWADLRVSFVTDRHFCLRCFCIVVLASKIVSVRKLDLKNHME